VKKAVLSVIALMLCLVFLAGCTQNLTTTGKKEKSSTTTTTTTTTTTQEETTTTGTQKQSTTKSTQKKPTTVNVKEEFCRVLYIEENGIVVSMPYTDWDYIYVKKDGIGSRVMSFETLVIKFLERDLKPQKGSFVGFDGKEAEFSYVLENPRGIRRPDSSKGEPTFG